MLLIFIGKNELSKIYEQRSYLKSFLFNSCSSHCSLSSRVMSIIWFITFENIHTYGKHYFFLNTVEQCIISEEKLDLFVWTILDIMIWWKMDAIIHFWRLFSHSHVSWVENMACSYTYILTYVQFYYMCGRGKQVQYLNKLSVLFCS